MAEGRERPRWDAETGLVLSHDPTGPDWRTLVLQAPRIAASALPGQFVQVDVRGEAGFASVDPLLRRPLSLCTIAAAEARVSLIYRVVGRGTALLAEARVGSRLSLLGPLGNPFPAAARHPGRPLVLVGGGLGIPPLAAAAAWAVRAGRPVSALLGARRAADLAGLAEVEASGATLAVATEDGSLGRSGLVTSLLAAQLHPADEVWACGPAAMLEAVRRVCAEAGAECWLSIERPMACGFGVCIGCTVPRAGGGYFKTCVDGPVFAAEELGGLF